MYGQPSTSSSHVTDSHNLPLNSFYSFKVYQERITQTLYQMKNRFRFARILRNCVETLHLFIDFLFYSH